MLTQQAERLLNGQCDRQNQRASARSCLHNSEKVNQTSLVESDTAVLSSQLRFCSPNFRPFSISESLTRLLVAYLGEGRRQLSIRSPITDVQCRMLARPILPAASHLSTHRLLALGRLLRSRDLMMTWQMILIRLAHLTNGLQHSPKKI